MRPGAAGCLQHRKSERPAASGRRRNSNVKLRSQTTVTGMHLQIRQALPEDAPACVHMRGLTRENAISPERLRQYGITDQSWAEGIRTGSLPGFVCHCEGKLLGYAFGDRSSGEVVVVALLPEAEAQGLGRRLLALLVQELRASGHHRLFLGCSPDPSSRSHGFYRHLGWRSTGNFDRAGDEILEYLGATAALAREPGPGSVPKP